MLYNAPTNAIMERAHTLLARSIFESEQNTVVTDKELDSYSEWHNQHVRPCPDQFADHTQR